MADATEAKAKRLKELEDEGRDAKGTKKAKQGKGGKGGDLGGTGDGKVKHPVRNTLLFTALFFLLLIGAVIAVCRLGYVDAAGDYVYFLDKEGVIRGPILTFLNPEENPREVYWEAELNELAERDAELTIQEEEMEAREAAADDRESALDEREDALATREELVNEWIASWTENNPQGMASYNDIISVMVTTVAGMDAKKAAAALSELDEDMVVRILSMMKAAKASAIMNNLDKEYAAELMALVFDPPDTVDYPDVRPGATETEDGTEPEAS